MRTDVNAWFTRATSVAADWPLEQLVAAKGATTVSVVLPALNEAETIASIVTQIRSELMHPSSTPLVDELVVLDSGSTDSTAHEAERAGATVMHRDDILPSIPPATGKGEAMWRAVAATNGDLVVFIDADLRSFTAQYVTGLLGPLLTDDRVDLVKAVYERPYVDGSLVTAAGGGRVTELVARPLLNLHWPDLAAVIQPLAGEYAARRTLLEQLPFPCGYGVELGLLIDTLSLRGLDAIAQVDLGVRVHRHHDERLLGRMSADILRTAFLRLDPERRLSHDLGVSLEQFDREGEHFTSTSYAISSLERPALASVPGYGQSAVALAAHP